MSFSIAENISAISLKFKLRLKKSSGTVRMLGLLLIWFSSSVSTSQGRILYGEKQMYFSLCSLYLNSVLKTHC